MNAACTAEVDISFYDVEAMFNKLEEVTEEQLGCTFDELSMIVARQPDDKLALDALRRLITEVRDQGYIEQAMQMAMTLGAMACMHDHMQGLANDVGNLIGIDQNTHSYGDHGSEHAASDDYHDSKTCKDCKAGHCRRKH